jgi:small subunit ribosomal protein S8
MMTDPLSDMLARLRNAAQARHETTEVPLSKLKLGVAELLKAEGYISDVKVEGRTMTVFLKYGRDRASAFLGIRRRSRPGRRLYVGVDRLPKVQNGFGVAILSTSHGIMTDRTAREKRIGGELLCEVW